MPKRKAVSQPNSATRAGKTTRIREGSNGTVNSGSDLWTAALARLGPEDKKYLDFETQDELDVLDDLKTLTLNAKDESIKDRWRFRRPGSVGEGETVILRDVFGKIVTWIDRFKEIGDIVVQYDPVHTALPWAGVRFLLMIATSDIKKFEYVVEGAELIARSISRFAITEKVYFHRQSPASQPLEALKEALLRLYAVIFQYLAKAKQYFGQKTKNRVVKTLIKPQAEFEDIMKKIGAEQLSVDHNARLVDAQIRNETSDSLNAFSIDFGQKHAELLRVLGSIDGPVCRMASRVGLIEDCLNVAERGRILSWLSSEPYQQHHQQVKRQTLQGTGQWLLQDPIYAKWLQDSSSSLLWLHGKPGSGKSTLISIVIEDAIRRFKSGQSPLPAYFYCSRTTAELQRSDPNAVMASILRQLSSPDKDMPLHQELVDKFKEHGEGFKSDGLMLQQSLELILHLTESHELTTIIVDALDECDRKTREILLGAFATIVVESAGLVKIFVSSRDDQDIVCTLREYPNLDISSNRNTADINTFVESETIRLVQKQKLLRNSRAKAELQALIIGYVREHADGMFRWASLQLEALCALKLDRDVRAKLGTNPPELEQLYDEVYNELTSYEGNHGRSIINNTLKWLLCARRTLRADEFLWALSVNLDVPFREISREHVLDLCHNLILYDESLDVFRFAHLSVREFLEKRQDFQQIPCHSLACESCLIQITASSRCSRLDLERADGRLVRLRDDLTQETEHVATAFLTYANLEWMDHCSFVSRTIWSANTSLRQLVESLFVMKNPGLKSAFGEWVQWYRSHMLDAGASEASWQLQGLLSTFSDALSRSFFLAVFFGFTELVATELHDQAVSDEIKGRGLILAAMRNQQDMFDILVSDGDWNLTEPILFHAVQNADTERLAWLLDKARKVTPTTRLVAAIGEDQSGQRMALLLERCHLLVITAQMLEALVVSISLNSLRLLLAKAPDASGSASSFEKAVVGEKLGNLLLLLDRFGDRFISSDLLEKAILCCQDSLDILLKRGGAARITERVMCSAARFASTQNLKLLLDHGGKSYITERVMCRAVYRKEVQTLRLMMDSGGKITQGVLTNTARLVRPDALTILLDNGSKVDSQTLRLFLGNIHGSEVLAMVLDHVDQAILAAQMPDLVSEAACTSWCQPSTIKLLLDRVQRIELPELAFLGAACEVEHGSEIMSMLLGQGKNVEITDDVLECAMMNLPADITLRLLHTANSPSITAKLLEAAAANFHDGSENVLMDLLERSDVRTIPDGVLDSAIRNWSMGLKMIHKLEKKFGPVPRSEDLMLRLLRQGSCRAPFEAITLTAGADYLFDPALVTEKVLFGAVSIAPLRLSHWWGGDRDRQQIVLENALHLPVKTDLLKAAAAFCDLKSFRFLWNRSSLTNVPECLIVEAARNSLYGPKIVHYLLDQADGIILGEEAMISIAASQDVGELLQSLFERKYQPPVTHKVLVTAIVNPQVSTELDRLVNLLLERFCGDYIAEELFEAAATAGHEDVLYSLSRFCGIEHPLSKWLVVARFYKAARDNDAGSLSDLLSQGFKLEAHQLDSILSMTWKREEEHTPVVRLLLSIGAAPDALVGREKMTPLWDAARGGWLEMAEALVNAGASLHSRDEEGYTPCLIAMRLRRVKVFSFLKQAMKDEEAARAARGADSLGQKSPGSSGAVGDVAVSSGVTEMFGVQ